MSDAMGASACEALIDLSALRANAAFARRLAGNRSVIAVVKADAYGHGVVDVAQTLLAAGCSRLAVLSVSEAAELREASIAAPILLLGGVRGPDEADQAISLRVSPVVCHADSLRWVVAAARRAGASARVHVEVDTGLHRVGVAESSAVDLMVRIADASELELEGVFTHLARADEPDLGPSLEQLHRFREVLAAAAARGVHPPLVHADNSAALMTGKRLREALPEATAVRPGLMLYGVSPANHLDPGGELQPVMTLCARVVQIHDVAPGRGVGYNATFRAPRRSGARVATIAIGYADGVFRSTGNRGSVWLAGEARPIVGQVSMDYVGVDIGSAPVRIGDQAILFGGRPGAGIPVDAAAEASGTIAYELLVRVGRRVPRRFLG